MYIVWAVFSGLCPFDLLSILTAVSFSILLAHDAEGREDRTVAG